MKKWLLVAAASAALLTGCGKKDEAEKTADGAIEAIETDLGKLSEINLRSGNPGKANDALAALSLDATGAGRVAFGDKDVSGADATFTNIVISPEADEDGATDTIQAGSLVFKGLDMTDAGATFSSMTLSDITIVPDDPEEATDADVTVGSLELINPSPETAAWVSSLLGKGAPAPFPTVDKLAFDAFTMANLMVDVHDDEDTGLIRIDGINIRGVGDETVERASLTGINFDMIDEEDGPIKFAIANMSVYGSDYGLIREIEALGDDPSEDAVGTAIMTAMSENPVDPPFDAMILEAMSFDGSGISFDLPLYDARVQRDGQDRMVGQVLKPVLMTLEANAEGGNGGAELAGMLGQLGYEKIELAMESVSTYDPDQDLYTFDAGKNYFELIDGMRMSFGGEIEGYAEYARASSAALTDLSSKKGNAVPDPDFMMDALSKLVIHGFELELDDDSLLDRGFNLYAAQSGEDPEQLKSQIAMYSGMAPMFAAQAGVDAELATEAASAFGAFIAEGGTLTLKFDPETPIRVSDIEDPSLLTKETLGFSATQK